MLDPQLLYCPDIINLQTTRYVLHAAFETLSKNRIQSVQMAEAMCLESVLMLVFYYPIYLKYLRAIVEKLHFNNLYREDVFGISSTLRVAAFFQPGPSRGRGHCTGATVKHVKR